MRGAGWSSKVIESLRPPILSWPDWPDQACNITLGQLLVRVPNLYFGSIQYSWGTWLVNCTHCDLIFTCGKVCFHLQGESAVAIWKHCTHVLTILGGDLLLLALGMSASAWYDLDDQVPAEHLGWSSTRHLGWLHTRIKIKTIKDQPTAMFQIGIVDKWFEILNLELKKSKLDLSQMFMLMLISIQKNWLKLLLFQTWFWYTLNHVILFVSHQAKRVKRVGEPD